MELQIQVNQIKDMLIQEMNKKSEIIFNGLLNHAPSAIIPEELFVNYFLPCFIGKVNNPNWVVEWISIAGGPMAEVGIKDKNNQLLYVIPSLLNTNNILLGNGGGSLTDIFTKYAMLNNNLPIQGTTFINNAFNEKTKEIFANYSTDSVNNRWMDILQRYGLIQASVVSKTESDNLTDSFEY